VPVHGLAPQNLLPDKHVDVCADGDEDRGSTPLASSPESFRGCHAGASAKADTQPMKQLCFELQLSSQPEKMASLPMFTSAKAKEMQNVSTLAAHRFLTSDCFGRQGIFAAPHSKLAIRAV